MILISTSLKVILLNSVLLSNYNDNVYVRYVKYALKGKTNYTKFTSLPVLITLNINGLKLIWGYYIENI